MILFENKILYYLQHIEEPPEEKENNQKQPMSEIGFSNLTQTVSIDLETYEDTETDTLKEMTPRQGHSECRSCLVRNGCNPCQLCAWLGVTGGLMLAFCVLFIVFLVFYVQDHEKD